jgi:hypothetical protein
MFSFLSKFQSVTVSKANPGNREQEAILWETTGAINNQRSFEMSAGAIQLGSSASCRDALRPPFQKCNCTALLPVSTELNPMALSRMSGVNEMKLVTRTQATSG